MDRSPSHKEKVNTPVHPEIELTKSYVGGELNCVSITDSRSETQEKYPFNIYSITFIFSADPDKKKLTISRIFANRENGGGHAIDSRPSIFSKYHVKDYGYRSLLDEKSMATLEGDFPEYTISTKRIRDRVKSLVRGIHEAI